MKATPPVGPPARMEAGFVHSKRNMLKKRQTDRLTPWSIFNGTFWFEKEFHISPMHVDGFALRKLNLNAHLS